MTELQEELAKVKPGQRYIDADNYPTIQRILHEQTPYFYTLEDGTRFLYPVKENRDQDRNPDGTYPEHPKEGRLV